MGELSEGLPTNMSAQERIGKWHVKRFPNAELEHVGLKLAEEAGEVAKAINGQAGKNSATGGGVVIDELADVVIVACVIAHRWTNHDLMQEVERKLAILNDPNSGHPARLREEQ